MAKKKKKERERERERDSGKHLTLSNGTPKGLHPRNKSELKVNQGFPGGAVVKNPPANAGDMCSIPGLGRSHMLQSN